MEKERNKEIEIFAAGFRCGETRRESFRKVTSRYATQAEIEADGLPIVRNILTLDTMEEINESKK